MFPLHRHWLRIAAVLAAVLLALGIARWRSRPVADPLIDTPQLALTALEARTLFFNAPALPWLKAQRPELLIAADTEPGSERTRQFAQAAMSPSLFRQLDRRNRFDAILLLGDPSQYRPLLDHLIETKDFPLVYVDHTSLIFRREAKAPWTLAQVAVLKEKTKQASAAMRAKVLALTAAKLTAAQRRADAKGLLDEALALDGSSIEAWTARANFAIAGGDFRTALDACNRALAIDSAHLGAMSAKAQVLYATKRYDEALTISTKLLERLPDQPHVLFKHAQIAHEAHAYRSEIDALNRLIQLAEGDQRSTTGYRLYLAQSYMAAGQGQPALDEFAKVLSDPELPADQRQFSTESVERIKKRTGL